MPDAPSSVVSISCPASRAAELARLKDRLRDLERGGEGAGPALSLGVPDAPAAVDAADGAEPGSPAGACDVPPCEHAAATAAAMTMLNVRISADLLKAIPAVFSARRRLSSWIAPPTTSRRQLRRTTARQ